MDSYLEKKQEPIAFSYPTLISENIVLESKLSFINGTDTVTMTGSIFLPNQVVAAEQILKIKVLHDNRLVRRMDFWDVKFTANNNGSEISFYFVIYPRMEGFGADTEILSLVFYYESENPLLRIDFSDLPRGERFQNIARINPIISMKHWKTYMISVFRAVPKGDAPIRHLSAPDIIRVSDGHRYEGTRLLIGKPTNLVSDIHINAMWYVIDDTAAVGIRPGFAWSPHHWSYAGHYMPTFILPAIPGILVYMVLLGILASIWRKSKHLKPDFVRKPIRLLAALLLCYIFISILLGFQVLLLLACCAAAGISCKIKPTPVRFYLFCLTPLILQELSWDILVPRTEISLSAFFISGSLYLLVLTPVLLLRRNSSKVIAYLLLVILSWSYYTWMNMYFDFFQKYPTFLELNYASQLSSVWDSVIALLDFNHLITAAYCVVPPLFYYSLSIAGKISGRVPSPGRA
ncbi:MAG: hypothetical protein OXC05_05730 [Halieaceae bacterium]|nr:hypothetical protein [Halieaceae bacterium]